MGIITRLFGSKKQRLQERMKNKEAELSKSLDHLMKSMDREEEILTRLKEIDEKLNGAANRVYDEQKPFEKGSDGTVVITPNLTLKQMNEIIAEGKKLIEELRSMKCLPKDEIDKLHDEIFLIHDIAEKVYGR